MVSRDAAHLHVDGLSAVVAAIEAKDHATESHNRRVAGLCRFIGVELGMKEPQLRVIARAGLVHDVGKIWLPLALLGKPSPLSPAEWKLIEAHPEMGADVLRRIGGFEHELVGVRYHHERMDGSGYPYGLSGEAIPMVARIVAVADTYDALISDRPYRSARSHSTAWTVMESEKVAHLDPRVVYALAKVLEHRRFLEPARHAAGHASTITGRA